MSVISVINTFGTGPYQTDPDLIVPAAEVHPPQAAVAVGNSALSPLSSQCPTLDAPMHDLKHTPDGYMFQRTLIHRVWPCRSPTDI